MGMVKKTASIVASLIIILAIGGFVAVRNFDLNRYKGYIEDIVLRETGRKLSLNGDAKIGLSLVPTLVINDVTFANPDWAQNPYMAKLEQLEIKFSLSALLHKQINIKKFVLIRPEVYLETAKDGKKNWEFTNIKTNTASNSNNGGQSVSQVKDARAVAAIGLIAKEVRLKDGHVNYFDAKTGQTTSAIINDIELEVENDQPIELSIDAVYDKNQIQAELQLSDIQKIMQSGDIEFEGIINALNIKTNITGSALNVMGDISYQVEANIYNPAGNFSAPETSLLARIDGDVNKADINIRSLNLATNLITGVVKIDWSKAKPYIDADLRSDVFNLKSLNKNAAISWRLPNLVSEAQALEVVPNDKIPYQYLNMLNGLFNIKVGKLILPDDMILLDILVGAKLNNGILTVNKLNTTVYGGKVVASGVVNANKQAISAKVNASQIKFSNLYNVLVDDDDFSISSGGLLDVDADLSATGATYRKCSENLSGQFTALIDKTVAKAGQIEWLTTGIIAELFKVLNINTNNHDELNVECVVVNSKIKGGKAEFNKGIVFNSDKLQLVSSGSINLVNDKIDFAVSPTLNKLSSGNLTQALASFVRLGGKLQDPSIKLDKTSTVSTVVGTIATNGLYLGGEVLLGSDDNLCYNALQGTKYVARFPKKESVVNSAKESYQDVAEQARDAAKEIRDAAKGLFKSLKNSLKGKQVEEK